MPIEISEQTALAKNEVRLLHHEAEIAASGIRTAAPLPDLAAGMFLEVDGRPLLQVERVILWPSKDGFAPACAVRALEDAELAPGTTATPATRGMSLAWITLSDKGSQGLREDRSGPLIEEMVREKVELSLCRGFVLPDDRRKISALLSDLCLTQKFDLVLTTGGTGLAPRDVTPEATLKVIERRLPGFEQAMMNISLQKTPHAAISRAVAGTLGEAIIINMPGSPKAVRENLEAVLPALQHASEKLKGDPSDCAQH